MPIVTADIKTMLSIPGATVGFTDAQPDKDDSLGEFMSTTEWLGGTLHDLFDPVTAQENIDLTVDYRCVFIHNTHATLTFIDCKVWIQSEVAGGADIAIGVDPAAASAEDAVVAQAAVIATEEDVPAGVAFTSPVDDTTAVAVGDIGPGECRALWIRRTPNNTPAVANDGGVLRIRGETT